MRERRARLSLITAAALAVVVPGAAAGLVEHSAGGRSASPLSVARLRMARTGPRSPPAIASIRGCRPRSRATSRGPSGGPASTGNRLPQSNPWRLQATLPNTVIKDISFASPTVGYIAGELGKVWKTTDGGSTGPRS